MSELVKTKRQVLLYSTVGKQKVLVETDAKTWGELIPTVLDKYGISDIAKFKCVIGDTKLTLESREAVLPDKDFALFILPKKTKAGIDIDNAPYRELKAEIKSILNENPDMKEFFSYNGRNWTQLSTDKMRELLKEYYGKTPKEESAEQVEQNASTEELVEAIDEHLKNQLANTITVEISRSTVFSVNDLPKKMKKKVKKIVKEINDLKEEYDKYYVKTLDDQVNDIIASFEDIDI
jgi:hypothetical protein